MSWCSSRRPRVPRESMDHELAKLKERFTHHNFGSSLGGGGGGIVELVDICLVLSIKCAGLARPSTVGQLRCLVDGTPSRPRTAEEELMRRVAVYTYGMLSEEF